MQGIIQKAQPSKSGKTLGVQIAGQWYSTKAFEMQNMVGQSITFETSTSEFNGTTMHWLNDYTVDSASSTPSGQAFDAAHAAATTPQAPNQATQPAGVPRKDPMAYLPMTSNVVAHAIASGFIDNPDKIAAWARAAFAAAKGVVEGVQAAPVAGDTTVDYDDDIPF